MESARQTSCRCEALEQYLGRALPSDVDDVREMRLDTRFPFISASGNEEGQLHLMGIRWRVFHSRAWQFTEHITALEMRSLVWAARHVLRSDRAIGSRFLLLSDSSVSVLASTRG